MLEQIFHGVVLTGLVGSLLTVLANLRCFETLRVASGFVPDQAPLVSILVPARNEARNLRACVGSLLAQDYPNFELIVLDDHSEDETATIAGELGLSAKTPGRCLMSGTALPAGWTGKNWACHQLSRVAKGEFLFFTDADTVHRPGMVGALVADAQRSGASLISAWPHLLTGTWGEKLVLPLIVFVAMALYPHWLMVWLEKGDRAKKVPARWLRLLGAANGQSLFFRASAYRQIGGHEAVRAHLVEDVALGRAIASRMGEGFRLRNCSALGLCDCRMYRSFWEVWEGFTKNVRPAFESSIGGFLGAGLSQTCLFVLPFFQLGLGANRWVWLELGLIYLIRALVGRRFGSSWWGIVLHPVAYLIALGIGLNSWRRSAGAGVTWKGRLYQPESGN